MATFRKFDPYAFLANQEEGARCEAAAEAPETLASLAPLAGEDPQIENRKNEKQPDVAKSDAAAAKAANLAKVGNCETETLASLATLAAPDLYEEYANSESGFAKAAKLANPSCFASRGDPDGPRADRSVPTPAKAAKPDDPFQPELGGVAKGAPTSRLLDDGRRLNRFRARGVPEMVPKIGAELADQARDRGAVLVADGLDLVVVEPRLRLPSEILRALQHEAGAIIAALRGESRARLTGIIF